MLRETFLGTLVAFAVISSGGDVSAQDGRLTLEGSVRNEKGEALPGARVSIATARVRKGVSPY